MLPFLFNKKLPCISHDDTTVALVSKVHDETVGTHTGSGGLAM